MSCDFLEVQNLIDSPDDETSMSNDDNFDVDEENIDAYVKGLFPRPLEIIDADADLEAVSKAKSIGEALQILCPNMPGIPSKARGKYQKRRFLNKAEKENMMRQQNRENARRTRIRRKIFSHFLKSSLSALEAAVPRKRNSMEALSRQRHIPPRQSTINSIESSCSMTSTSHSAPSSPCISSTSSNLTSLEDIRIQNSRNFLLLRWSRAPETQNILKICVPEFLNITPYPTFRKSRGTESDEKLETRGCQELISENFERRKYIESILPQRNWAVVISLNADDVSFSLVDNSIIFPYEYTLYDGGPLSIEDDSSSSSSLTKSGYITPEPLTDPTKYKVATRIRVHCHVHFNNEGRIALFRTFYDVNELREKMTFVYKALRISFPTDAISSRRMADVRVGTARKFIALRFSVKAEEEDWDSLCDEDVVHVLPVPIYRKVSSLGVIKDTYQCHGLEAIIDDTKHRERYLSTMVEVRGGHPSTWMIDVKIRQSSVVMSTSGNRLSFTYDLIVYAEARESDETSSNGTTNPFTSGAQQQQQQQNVSWLVILEMTVDCEVVFAPDGRLVVVHERFDQNDSLNPFLDPGCRAVNTPQKKKLKTSNGNRTNSAAKSGLTLGDSSLHQGLQLNALEGLTLNSSDFVDSVFIPSLAHDCSSHQHQPRETDATSPTSFLSWSSAEQLSLPIHPSGGRELKDLYLTPSSFSHGHVPPPKIGGSPLSLLSSIQLTYPYQEHGNQVFTSYLLPSSLGQPTTR